VNKWSLEDLELYLEIDCGGDGSAGSSDAAGATLVEGLVLEGAQFDSAASSIRLSEELRCRLPLSRLSWRRKQDRPVSVNSSIGTEQTQGSYQLFPLYLNEGRGSLVAQVLLQTPGAVPKHVWSQRGVAFVMNSSSI
jgi:hypothetical protein